MMKAYERVEWSYLRDIMEKLGLAPSWISIVVDMVSSISFSVLFNGNKLEELKPTRGIRQRDSISPYLFLLAEGLSCLLKSQNKSSHLSSINMAPSAPPVNHVLFADDSQLFFKAIVSGPEEVSNLMDTYCLAYGQRINKDKSSIFFSKGCPQSDKYLGMRTEVGQSKRGTFKYLSDPVWDKVKGWMGKLLSFRGKDVLVKAVAQAIPLYSMACFKLPRGLCEHLNSIIRKIWWGCKEGKRKPTWVSSEVMTRPKYPGFRNLEVFNLALSARRSWSIMEDPSLLSDRILKAVYFPNDTILTAELGSCSSQIWRANLEGRDVMKQGIIRRIGNGQSTKIWSDNWIPRESSLRPLLSLVDHLPELVLELLLPATTSWNEPYLFLPMDADQILKVPVCTRDTPNFWP